MPNLSIAQFFAKMNAVKNASLANLEGVIFSSLRFKFFLSCIINIMSEITNRIIVNDS